MAALTSSVYANPTCEIKAGWMERPSYQYADRRGNPQGYDIAYIKALAKEMNCSAKFIRMPWFRQDKEM